MKVDGAEVVCWYGLLSVHVLGMGFMAGPPARFVSVFVVVGRADVREMRAVKKVVVRSMVDGEGVVGRMMLRSVEYPGEELQK
jgi:hypothetical protein